MLSKIQGVMHRMGMSILAVRTYSTTRLMMQANNEVDTMPKTTYRYNIHRLRTQPNKAAESTTMVTCQRTSIFHVVLRRKCTTRRRNMETINAAVRMIRIDCASIQNGLNFFLSK